MRDDAHFTGDGSAMLAGLISDYLLAREPLDAMAGRGGVPVPRDP